MLMCFKMMLSFVRVVAMKINYESVRCDPHRLSRHNRVRECDTTSGNIS